MIILTTTADLYPSSTTTTTAGCPGADNDALKSVVIGLSPTGAHGGKQSFFYYCFMGEVVMLLISSHRLYY